MLLFVFCLLSPVYGLQNGQNTIPAVLNSVGVGYNILRGNPDGAYWRHGGEDPGLLATRRILKTGVPNQVVYVRQDSCQSYAIDRLIYSPKTYQDHLGHRVTFAGTSLPSLQASAFTLSADYLTVKHETDTLHYVLQDHISTCINGTARYTLNPAPVSYYHLTDEFMKEVCFLPEVYDADVYMHFLDRWGTHLVTGMEIGVRQTTMTIGTRRNYIEAVYKKSSADVTVGGPLYNRGSSLVVDLETFKLRPSFPITVGNFSYKLTTGSEHSSEPIGLHLTSIDMTLTDDFWNSLGVCPNSRTVSIYPTRRQNIIKALQQYASQKGADRPTAEKLAMPVVWPTGTVGVPKPKDGCPSASRRWQEGWLRQNPETQTPTPAWNVTHLDATMSRTIYLLKFCVKPYTSEEFSIDWPAGDYCIFKYEHCPPGFSEGFVQWDDEDTNNMNYQMVSTGEMSDGHTDTPVVLPTERPFFLFQYKTKKCQSVHGMTSSMEYIIWDDEDSKATSSAAIGDVHPRMRLCNPPKYAHGCGTGSTIYYCYYTKQSQIPNIIIVFVFCLLSPVYGLQNGQNTIPAVLNSVGVGYNILRGNPDGTDWRHGGEDPGLLATRRILKLESESSGLPDQLVYVRHDSCQSTAVDRLIYSPKTYQDHLGHRVSFAGTSVASLQASAFTLSAGYLTVKKETDTLHYVLQDLTSTCINGTARYTLNLASVNYYHLTDEFMTDVCSLPEVFAADDYMHFLDRWGTHVVTGMKIGSRKTTMTIGTRRNYIEAVYKKSNADVSIGGPLNSRDSSWVVDLETFKLRPSFPITVGNTSYKLTTGSEKSPEPIGLNLTSIDITLTDDFWNNEQYSLGVCPNNITVSIAIRRQNIIKALQQYASQKGADRPTAEKLAMPVVWPTGTVGLPKPKDGCPSPSSRWQEGWLRQNPETQTPDNEWNVTHLDATMSRTSYLLKFCVKPYTSEEFSMAWPAGDYCIFKYEHCPLGFLEGFVQWDDEDTKNANAHGGVLPDGVYGRDVRMKYCCRSDGHSYTPVVLPSERPFFLFQYKTGCQSVHGMTSSVEYIFWDDEDSKTTTSAAIGAVHPGMKFCNPPKYPGCGTRSTIYYCYYTKQSQIPNIIG